MTEGFFTKKETQSKSRPDGKSYSCTSCGLHKKCNSPRMEPYGNFKKRILNIGEAPGEVEDKVGKPWQGRTGKLLQKAYKDLGIDLFEDCLNIHAINCRPTDKNEYSRVPTNYEADCCRRSVLNIVYKYKPRVIVLFGNLAVYSLIGHRWKKDLGGISKWRGWTIPDQDFKAWVCPTFHPSFIERADINGTYKNVENTIWKQDLKQVVSLLETQIYEGRKTRLHPFPVYKDPQIEIITDLSPLNKIVKGEIAFDYETTGIKSHSSKQEIVCCSVADTEDHAYVFMMPKTERELQPLIRLLTDPKVGKIASNMKYEHSWTKTKLKIVVSPWVRDTMIVAHIHDNRPGVTGLKFQVYVQFGVVDYASEVAPYLQSVDSTDANSVNKIFDLLKRPGGKRSLLTYCGYDSVYEYRLAQKQRLNELPF